jgi:hypothetical protein
LKPLEFELITDRDFASAVAENLGVFFAWPDTAVTLDRDHCP